MVVQEDREQDRKGFAMRKANVKRKREARKTKILLDILGSEFGGNQGSVPVADIRFRPADPWRCINVGDDGFMLWFGGEHEWNYSLQRREARRLAWWILIRWWAWGEWFGLRRWLYYKALHRHVSHFPSAAGGLAQEEG